MECYSTLLTRDMAVTTKSLIGAYHRKFIVDLLLCSEEAALFVKCIINCALITLPITDHTIIDYHLRIHRLLFCIRLTLAIPIPVFSREGKCRLLVTIDLFFAISV